MPVSDRFGPLDIPGNKLEPVSMSVDEYETIRLIDLEDKTQEECAVQMNVARTAVQRVYNDARRKLAEALVEGKMLKIDGGDYELYGEKAGACKAGCCRRQNRQA